MRRTSLLCVLLLLTLGVAWAGDIYIPANTPATGSRNNWPFNPTFGPEWRYQMVFTATQLGNQPLNITEIAFAPYQTGTLTAQDFEVRMSHTKVAATSTFATNLPNPQTMLLVKTHVWQTTHQTWSTLGLTSPFSYNGVDSLTFEVRYRNGTASGFSGTCYYDSNNHPRIYSRGAAAYTATTGSMDNHGLKIRITTLSATITLSGSTSPGGTVDLDLDAPSDAGKVYQLASSLGLGPIPIGSRQIDLSADALLVITVNNFLPTMFKNYTGVLDAQGKAKAQIVIPKESVLIGLRIHSAFVTLDAAAPMGISLISPTASFTVQ